MRRRFIAAGVLTLAVLAARGETTIDSTNHVAYGANIGWVEMRGDETNGLAVGRFYCTGMVWSANCGWISFGNGPTNGWEYSNLAGNDWGVNHDGTGGLSGLAYGANIGWVVLEQTQGVARVDLATGKLSGYAYGANVGWISLSNVQAHVQTDWLEAGPDTDADGIPDPWEWREAGDLTTLSGGDHDEDDDGVTDTVEYGADTDPLDDGSLLAITEQEVVSNTNRLTWTVEDTRFYTVVESTNLLEGTNWTDAGLGLMTPDPGGWMTRDVAAPTGEVQRMYGIRATVPLGE